MSPTVSPLLLVGFVWWKQLSTFLVLIVIAALWWKDIRAFRAEEEEEGVKKRVVSAMFRSPAAALSVVFVGVFLVDRAPLLSPVLVVVGLVWFLVQLRQKRKAEGSAP